MNKIYVDINFTNQTLEKKGVDLISGDYASTEIEFTFDREDGTKMFEMKSPSGELVYADEIVDNKVLLTAKDENDNNVSLFDEEGYYIFEVSLYGDGSKLTSVYGELPVQKEQVIVEGEPVERVLPLFEQLMQHLQEALTETNNLNIEAQKVEHTTTITITRKDGTTESVQVLDGEKGEQGEPGVPGAVKFIIVQTLPTEDIQTDAIYLVPSEEPTTQDLYQEYMYINNQWELLGQKQIVVDLQNYVQFTDYALQGKPGVVQPSAYYGTQVVGNGVITGYPHTYQQYLNSVDSRCVIDKTTFENVITGKGLINNQVNNLANYYTKTEIDNTIGDIGTILDSINGESVGD